MATLLKRTGITQFAPNFCDMLFMVIKMALARFILGAKKYAKKKNCPKMAIFVHSVFLPITLVQNKNLEIPRRCPLSQYKTL